jgi:DNA-directed RNA polymerase subunit K/omega
MKAEDLLIYDVSDVSASIGGYKVIWDPDLRVTRDVLNIYELARCWGTRTNQLARGAPQMLKVEGEPRPVEEIAALEIRTGRTPMIVLRPLPGYKELTADGWLLSDLRVPDSIWPTKPIPLNKMKITGPDGKPLPKKPQKRN